MDRDRQGVLGLVRGPEADASRQEKRPVPCCALAPPESGAGGSAPGQQAGEERVAEPPGLCRAALSGRLTELSGQGNLANLTLACEMVLSAQREGEPAAWITDQESSFYPPDAAEMGIDLAALAVVRCPGKKDLARVADRLGRSGAFGLLILDLGTKGDVPVPLQSRLAGLARRHGMAVVFLTQKADDVPSLGSLVSLRGQTLSSRSADGRFVCSFRAVKDKRRSPGWVREGVYRGTPGLC